MADVNEQQAAWGSNGFSHPAGASATVLADSFNRKVESQLGDRVILKPLTRWNVSSLPIMEKDEQFLRVIGILLSSVATINSAYNENNPCLNSTPMLLE